MYVILCFVLLCYVISYHTILYFFRLPHISYVVLLFILYNFVILSYVLSISCYIMSCCVMFCYVMLCHVLLRHVVSCFVTPCYIIVCYGVDCHVLVISCYPSCQVMTCNVVWQLFWCVSHCSSITLFDDWLKSREESVYVKDIYLTTVLVLISYTSTCTIFVSNIAIDDVMADHF